MPLFRHLLETPHSSPALIARAADGLHPLCGIYRREALPVIERFLASGRLKLLDLLDELDADIATITPDLPFFRPGLFLNVNDTRLLQQLNDDTRGKTR
jgi:molybdopterin-guanine dinucleotide biosynthesis protein A